MASLPDPQRVVGQDQSNARSVGISGRQLEAQKVMDRVEEIVEPGLACGIMVSSDEDDPSTGDPTPDRLGRPNLGVGEVADEITEVQQNVIRSDHVVDAIDQALVHGLDVIEVTPESTTDRILAEMRVRGDEDPPAQLHERPSGSRLKLTQPSEVTATMSSTRIPPSACA